MVCVEVDEDIEDERVVAVVVVGTEYQDIALARGSGRTVLVYDESWSGWLPVSQLRPRRSRWPIVGTGRRSPIGSLGRTRCAIRGCMTWTRSRRRTG